MKKLISVFLFVLFLAGSLHCEEKAAEKSDGNISSYNEVKKEIFLTENEKTVALKKIADLSEQLKNTENGVLYAERGSLYISLWKYFEAMEDFKKAIAIDPFQLGAQKKLASSFFFLGRDEEALKQYNSYRIAVDYYSMKSGDKEILKEFENANKMVELLKKLLQLKNDQKKVSEQGSFIELRNKKNCYVWNPFPVYGEWFEWSGECKNGKASGKGTLTDSDGMKIEGSVFDGKINGHAVKTYPGGLEYVGDLYENLSDGKGAITFPGGIKFEGAFSKGKISGEGKFLYPGGGELTGLFQGFLPTMVKSAKCNGEDTEYFIFRSKEGKFNTIPLINCPKRK